LKQKPEKGGSAVIIPFPRYRIKRVPERTVVLVPYLNLTQQKDPSGGSSDAMTLGIALPYGSLSKTGGKIDGVGGLVDPKAWLPKF